MQDSAAVGVVGSGGGPSCHYLSSNLSSILRLAPVAIFQRLITIFCQPQMMIHNYGRLLIAATCSAALATEIPYEDCSSAHSAQAPTFSKPGHAHTECKCFPGDHCWPSKQDWDSLNQTVDGRLVATVPLASPCYHSWDNYDNATCTELRDTWTKADTHIDSSSSIMAPFFANRSKRTSQIDPHECR